MANTATEPDSERREPKYPCYNLRGSLRIGEGVRDLGGSRTEVSKSVLAHKLKAQETTAFTQIIGAAKCYRIIEGTRTYKLTDLGKRYFYPTSDSDQRLAQIEFFESPRPFRLLIDRFDGEELPDVEHLGNILLHEDAVPSSWSARVAAFFFTAAKEIGLLDEGGILRVAASKAAALAGRPVEGELEDAERQRQASAVMFDQFFSTPRRVPSRVAAPSQPQTQQNPPRAVAETNVWTYTVAGKTVRLETPLEMPRALWEVLDKFVDILKPPEDKRESP